MMQRYTKYTSSYMRDQLLRVHEAYQAIRKKYDGKFDPTPPRAMFKGSYGAYREENAALDQKYAFQDTGLTTDPWEKFSLE